MSAAVRPARPADRAAAVALWQALHREHERMDVRYRLAPAAALRWALDFDEWVKSDADCILLADVSGETVGLLVAHLAHPTPAYAPGVFVYVDDLYVAPAHRGRGAARGLLGGAVAWGRRHGAHDLRAGVLATNEAGRRFWAGRGAADFAVTVTLPL